MKLKIKTIGLLAILLVSFTAFSFSNEESSSKRPYECHCTWFGQVCRANGYGKLCVWEGYDDGCWIFDKNCQRNLEEDN